MKRILFIVLLSFFSTSVLATQIDKCKIEGIATLVKKTQHDGYWGLVYDVEVFAAVDTDGSASEYCESVVKTQVTHKGMFRVSTGVGGTDEPKILSTDRQWFVWTRIDSGRFVGESFAPFSEVKDEP